MKHLGFLEWNPVSEAPSGGGALIYLQSHIYLSWQAPVEPRAGTTWMTQINTLGLSPLRCYYTGAAGWKTVLYYLM